MNKDKNPKDWQKIKEESEVVDPVEDLDAETEEQEEEILEFLSPAELQEQLELEKQKLEQAIRSIAKLENELKTIRFRAERDLANEKRYGSEKAVQNFLPIGDSLEQALQLAEKHADESMQEGLSLTLRAFLDSLKKLEVEQIDPEGEAFNPQEHEAMSIQEVPGVPANTVLNVLQKGYKLNDRVIRPARVIVAK